MASKKQGEMNIVDENKMRDEKQGEESTESEVKHGNTHCNSAEGDTMSARESRMTSERGGKQKQTHRKLGEVSDEELRVAAEKANSFPELKRLLGINVHNNARIIDRAERAGISSDVFSNYHIGK